MAEDLLIPMGRPLGMVGTPPSAVFQIALGDAVIELDGAAFAAWELAAHADGFVAAEALVLARAARRMAGPADGIDDLLASGALRAVGERDVDLLRFAREVRFVPLLAGLGTASLGDPHVAAFGVNDQPVLAVPTDVFEVAAFSHLHRCLGDAIVAQAATAVRRPLDLLRELMSHLPAMLGTGCGYLDVSRTPVGGEA